MSTLGSLDVPGWLVPIVQVKRRALLYPWTHVYSMHRGVTVSCGVSEPWVNRAKAKQLHYHSKNSFSCHVVISGF